MPKEEVTLNRALRLINSGPVVLVTAAAKGRMTVMAAAWATPVSSTPPLVVVAIHPARFTHELIQKSGEFVLNVPHADLAKKVNYCGSVSGRDHDKFKEAGLTPVEAKKVGAPWIAECIGHLECGVVAAHVTGDHTLFVGQVLAAWVESGTFDRVWLVDKEEARLLHHLGGNSYCVSSGRFEL